MGWHENLQKEDVPPEYLWEDGEGLELWWQKVENRRSDGRPDLDSPNRAERDDGDEPDGHQPPGMAENDLARHLKQM